MSHRTPDDRFNAYLDRVEQESSLIGSQVVRLQTRQATYLILLALLAITLMAVTVSLVFRDKEFRDRITKQEILLQDAVAAQQAYQDRVLEVLRDRGMIEALPSGSTSGTPTSD